MLERDCEAGVFPYCLENNIAVVPFSSIASGFLLGKINTGTQFEKVDDVRNFVPQLQAENSKANQPVLDLLESYASKKNVTNAHISLAWMLKKNPNVVPILGSKNKGRIIENLDAGNVELSDDEFNALEIHGRRGINKYQGMSIKDWGKRK